MAYIKISDFKIGMDRRRSRVAGTPGSCWDIVNGHLTRGAEVERRKKFVSRYTLSASETFGLAVLNDQLYVFGSIAEGSLTTSLPGGVKYQRLQHADSSTAMTEVIDWEVFDGKLYVVAGFADGAIYHYYNGSRVTAWDAIAQTTAGSTHAFAASRLAEKIDGQTAYIATAAGDVVTIEAATPGTDFTIAKSTTNGSGGTNDQDIALSMVQANVAAVSEVLASADIQITGGAESIGSNQITSVTVNSVELLASAVDWQSSNTTAAAQLASAINSNTTTPNYSASSSGDVVTIEAAEGTGSGPNGFALAVTTGGAVTVLADLTMTGGVSAVTAVSKVVTATLSGTIAAADLDDIFTLTLDGTDYKTTLRAGATGTRLLTFRGKVYTIVSTILRFSALNDATDWSGTGAGFINMGNQHGGKKALRALDVYQGFMAIFEEENTRIWSIVEDETANAEQEVIPDTGTVVPGGVLAYGNRDVFYLDVSGIRSLRARDSSNAATVNDVGTAIDPFLLDFVDTLNGDTLKDGVSILEPVDNRYWLALKQRIFVFTYFPGSDVTAWSYYDLADDVGADVEEIVKIRRQVFLRAGDTIYQYGGANGDTYPDADEIECTVGLPYLDAGDPGTQKNFRGFDLACEGTWNVKFLTDPARESTSFEAANVARTNYAAPHFSAAFVSTHVAPVLVASDAGAAKLIGMNIHYDDPHETG